MSNVEALGKSRKLGSGNFQSQIDVRYHTALNFLQVNWVSVQSTNLWWLGRERVDLVEPLFGQTPCIPGLVVAPNGSVLLPILHLPASTSPCAGSQQISSHTQQCHPSNLCCRLCICFETFLVSLFSPCQCAVLITFLVSMC